MDYSSFRRRLRGTRPCFSSLGSRNPSNYVKFEMFIGSDELYLLRGEWGPGMS
jgi:hypothetical protein